MDTCTVCDDEKLTKECTCVNCGSTWTRLLDHFERAFQCPVHHNTVCCYPTGGRDGLCTTCTDAGYALEITGSGFAQEFTIIKK